MNLETTNRGSGAAIGFIVAIILFASFAVVVKIGVNVPAIDANRATDCSKALAEMRSAEEKSLNTLGWADQSRGVVRLPIETAMQQTAQAWQNPAAARVGLNARQEKASAELPKAPEKPSAFE